MAKRLLQKKIIIDAFVSSPAKRAKKTAQLFADAYGRHEGDVIYISALYQAPAEFFYEVIDDLDDHFDSVAIFAHNPGITHFVNDLTDAVKLDNLPTCGVFAVSAAITQWSVFAKAKTEFLFYDYPKNI